MQTRLEIKRSAIRRGASNNSRNHTYNDLLLVLALSHFLGERISQSQEQVP